MVERKVHPADISFQLRMLAERVDRFVNGSSPSTALNGSSPSAAPWSVKPGVGP
jgi:hypothetical protein